MSGDEAEADGRAKATGEDEVDQDGYAKGCGEVMED